MPREITTLPARKVRDLLGESMQATQRAIQQAEIRDLIDTGEHGEALHKIVDAVFGKEVTLPPVLD